MSLLKLMSGCFILLLSLPLAVLGIINVCLSQHDSYPDAHPNMLEGGLIWLLLGLAGFAVGGRQIARHGSEETQSD